MMALMQMNLILNEDLSSRCIVAELNWGEAIPEGIPAQPDVLLLADCVYLEVAFQPLVDTMKAMSTRETEILVRYSSVVVRYEARSNAILPSPLLPCSSATNNDER